MLNTLKPVVGTWYLHRDKGQMFQVIDIDEEGLIVEVQHFDGDLDKIEFVEWRNMQLDPGASPEDWTGPVDDIEVDDLGYTETDMTLRDWRGPLAEIPWQEPSLGMPDLGKDDEDFIEALSRQ